jgi:hypothetical protein
MALGLVPIIFIRGAKVVVGVLQAGNTSIMVSGLSVIFIDAASKVGVDLVAETCDFVSLLLERFDNLLRQRHSEPSSPLPHLISVLWRSR